VGALVLLLCALAACQVAPRQPAAETGRGTPGRDRSVTAGELARGRWSRLPEAPIPDRGNPAAVWTGRELLVWGGTPSRTPGAGTGMVFTAARS
jgi:hypothetical protein